MTSRPLTPLFAAAVLAGCGPSNGRNELTGAVTYGGRPIPAGILLFEPDGAKGNTGPAAMVQFRDGRYKTDPHRGVVAGPPLVRVQGFDGVADAAREMPGGRPLFGEKVIPVDVPAGGGQLDLAVPADAKKP